MSMLQRMLEYQDYYSIFGMIVRQYRMLVQMREQLDLGMSAASAGQALGMRDPHFFVDQFGGGSASHTVVGQAAFEGDLGILDRSRQLMRIAIDAALRPGDHITLHGQAAALRELRDHGVLKLDHKAIGGSWVNQLWCHELFCYHRLVKHERASAGLPGRAADDTALNQDQPQARLPSQMATA